MACSRSSPRAISVRYRIVHFREHGVRPWREAHPFGSWILENGGMAEELRLSLGEARRLAVRSQQLAGPKPAAGLDGLRQVLRGLRVLQLDPVNVVARSHLL